jgi:hypothetical protein
MIVTREFGQASREMQTRGTADSRLGMTDGTLFSASHQCRIQLDILSHSSFLSNRVPKDQLDRLLFEKCKSGIRLGLT